MTMNEFETAYAAGVKAEAASLSPSAACPSAGAEAGNSRPDPTTTNAPANDGSKGAAPEPRPQRGSCAEARSIADRLAAIGVGGNVLLSAFKLIAGIQGNSTALISDAVHSLSDVLATAIAYIGTIVAQRPSDASHPYGHERFESLASLGLGIVLAAAGIGIGWGSVQDIATGAYRDAGAPSLLAAIAASVSVVVKEAMFRYTKHWARVMRSDAFMADAWHHRSDAYSSLGALAGIGGSMAGLPICDAIASAAISVVILKVSVDVLRDAVRKLVDAPCDPAFESDVRRVIEAVPGVVRIDALRTRRFGSKAYIDAEIAVDGNISLQRAHFIAEKAHRRVESSFPEVKHIMIHENPAESVDGR